MRVPAGLISLACLLIALCGCGGLDETADKDYKIIRVGQYCTNPDWLSDNSAITAIEQDADWIGDSSGITQIIKWLLTFHDPGSFATIRQFTLSSNAVAHHRLRGRRGVPHTRLGDAHVGR